MSGALLLFTPLSIPSIVHGLYLYIFVIVLYCVWSTLAFLDLAQVENDGTNRIWLWSGLVLLVPLVGGATYLLVAPSTISRHTRRTIVLGGIAILAVAYGYTAVWTA